MWSKPMLSSHEIRWPARWFFLEVSKLYSAEFWRMFSWETSKGRTFSGISSNFRGLRICWLALHFHSCNLREPLVRMVAQIRFWSFVRQVFGCERYKSCVQKIVRQFSLSRIFLFKSKFKKVFFSVNDLVTLVF